MTLSVMNERELAVLHQLQQRFSHASAERVISGPGLVTLYDALVRCRRCDSRSA